MDSKRYVSMVSEIEEIVSVFSDVEGGAWFLAIFCELLQDMVDMAAFDAARRGIEKLYEVAEANKSIDYQNREVVGVFLFLLTERILGVD